MCKSRASPPYDVSKKVEQIDSTSLKQRKSHYNYTALNLGNLGHRYKPSRFQRGKGPETLNQPSKVTEQRDAESTVLEQSVGFQMTFPNGYHALSICTDLSHKTVAAP